MDTKKNSAGKFRRHFFVCVNDQTDGGRGACGNVGGHEIADQLQAALLTHPKRLSDTAVTRTACLGLCQQGPVLVVYPEGVWYTQVDSPAMGEIIAHHLARGIVYEPNRFHWANTDEDDDEGKIS